MPDVTPPAPDASKQAWRDLWAQLAAITPKQVGRILMALLAVGALAWIAIGSWPALRPFLVGGIIAYTVLPLVDALDRVMPRLLAAMLGVLLAIAVMAGLIYVIAPPLIVQLIRLIDALPDPAQIDKITAALAAGERFAELPPLVQRQLLNLVATSLGRVYTTADGLIPSLFGGAPILTLLNTFSNIIGLIVLPTWALVLLKDQPRAWPTLSNIVPPGLRRDARALVRIVDRAFGSFFRGQVLVGIVIGLATYGGLSLLETLSGQATQYKLPLAVLAGLLQLIPEVGPVVNIIGTTLLALATRGQFLALQVLILYVAIQWLTGKLLADRFRPMSDVHPVVLVLVIVALTQLGPGWFFFAAPVAAVARESWRYVFGRLKEPAYPAGLLPSERAAWERRQAAQAARPLPAVYRRH